MRREPGPSDIVIQTGSTRGEAQGLVNADRKHEEGANRRRADQGEPYDEVWCVIDVEAPQPQNSLVRAAAPAKDSGNRIATSGRLMRRFRADLLSDFRDLVEKVDARLGQVSAGRG